MTTSKALTHAEARDAAERVVKAALNGIPPESMASRIVSLVWRIKGWPNATEKRTPAEFLAGLEE